MIKETVDARKESIPAEHAWDMLKKAEEIVIGKGKKYLRYEPSQENKAEILANCLGRTGNLRAPTLRVGRRFIVGFQEDMYRDYLGR